MNHYYQDILSRIDKSPVWWDEHAVPRFCEFSPNEVANIYCDEAVLFTIACQGCSAPFDVAMTGCVLDRYRWVQPALDECGEGKDERQRLWEIMQPQASLALAVLDKVLHYGDPPNYGCCPAGPTMNSVPVLVKEFWARASRVGWTRIPQLEREIVPDWAKEDAWKA